MAKNIITDLVHRLQLVMMALTKTPGNWASILVAINQYLWQTLYNLFKNIDKALGFNRFFCYLRMVIRQFKSIQMIVALWALNNITAHRLLTACCRVPLDSYQYQITNNFKKLLDLKGEENTSMITVPILLVFRIHIGRLGS